MTGEQVREALRPYLGYFPNTIRENRVTCRICSTPVDGYDLCRRCQQDRSGPTADRVAALVYAIAGAQTGYVMRGYKSSRPAQEWLNAVRLLLALALGRHARCVDAVAGQSVQHWVTVPSLPAKSEEHMLHRLVRDLGTAPGSEIRLAAAPTTSDPRAFHPAHFTALDAPIPGSHVLVLDDTWTTGGRAQSAAAAVRAAGAGQVSVLTLSRWLEPSWSTTGQFVKARLARPDYNPAICPWTGTFCP